MTVDVFSHPFGHLGLLALLVAVVLALGIASGALLNARPGAPEQSLRQQGAMLKWVTLTVLACVAVVLLTFAHQRAHVTADWSPFEGELATSIALFLVFAAGLVASWNSLRLRSPERR